MTQNKQGTEREIAPHVLEVKARTAKPSDVAQRREGWLRREKKQKERKRRSEHRQTPTFAGPGAKRTNEDPNTVCLNT